jgi:hypothetical protein
MCTLYCEYLPERERLWDQHECGRIRVASFLEMGCAVVDLGLVLALMNTAMDTYVEQVSVCLPVCLSEQIPMRIHYSPLGERGRSAMRTVAVKGRFSLRLQSTILGILVT